MRKNAEENEVLKELYKKCQSRQIVLRHSDTQESLLTFVPRIKDHRWFRRKSALPGGLFEQIAFMSKEVCHEETREPIAVDIVLQALFSKYPNSFKTFVKSKNMIDEPKRLGPEASIAALKDCNMNETQIEKLNRHMYHHVKYRPFAPKRKITELCGLPPTPEIKKVDVLIPKPKKNRNQMYLKNQSQWTQPTLMYVLIQIQMYV